ncbi:MAG: radical SAM protein [Myxococcales bacterium]|nr:radical SAM protein [Myxococcales bacterium]
MSLRTTLGSAARFGAAALLGRPTLLGLGWSITQVCNARCPFCSRHGGPAGVSTEAALDLVDQLASVGCRRVHFTGGEPLTRADLSVILSRVRQRQMTSSVNTNGVLLTERPSVIERADAFLVSLDGPAAIHDAYRGAGSHDRTLAGLAALSRARKPVLLSITLFERNLDQVPYFLDVARRFGARLVLQPGATHVLGSKEPNPEAPDARRYRAVIRALSADPAQAAWVWNSPRGLRELARYPERHRLRAHGGRITARLEVDGRLFPCSRSVNDPSALPAPNVLELGVREAFRRLRRIDCSGHVCQCAHNVEKSLLFSLEPSAWWNLATRRFAEARRMAG